MNVLSFVKNRDFIRAIREEERALICTGNTVFTQEEIQQWAGLRGQGEQNHLGSR